jgi:hypothetical protein
MPKLKELQVAVQTQQGAQTFLMDENKAKSMAESYFIAPDVYERICWLLLVEMSINLDVNGVSPFSISDQIRYLESDSNRGTQMKRATQFLRPPLYPLWHQHYFSAHFVAKNIYEEFKRRGKGRKIIEEIFDPKKSEIVTDGMIRELSHRTTVELFEQRASESRSTGEWLIFSEHEGVRYYLCLATHATPDQQIYEKLKIICRMQFPFLEPFAADRSIDDCFKIEGLI